MWSTHCYALLKLFDAYAPLKETEAEAKRSDSELAAYKKAQALQFISKITKRVYEQNEKEIRRISAQIEELSSGLERGLLDVDATASEQAIWVKQAKFRKKFNSIFEGFCSYTMVFAANHGRLERIFDNEMKEKWRTWHRNFYQGTAKFTAYCFKTATSAGWFLLTTLQSVLFRLPRRKWAASSVYRLRRIPHWRAIIPLP